MGSRCVDICFGKSHTHTHTQSRGTVSLPDLCTPMLLGSRDAEPRQGKV